MNHAWILARSPALSRSKTSAATCVSGLLFLLASQVSAGIWQVDIDSRPQDHFEHVSYRLWLPDDLARAHGIIVLHHGCGVTGGLLHASDVHYQALATKWRMALLTAAEWQSPDAACEDWARIERGSADAFLAALSQLATKSGHPELATARWALWGHSGGAVWVTAMTAQFPNRVIATFARSGAFGPANDLVGPGPVTLDVSDAMRRVPIMFCYGAKEEPEGQPFTHLIKHVRDVYNLGGRQSRWALAVDPTTGHENGDTRYLTFRFFDAVFAQTPELSPASGAEPSPVTWQGDPRSLAIAPAGKDLKRGDVALSWLVNESFAHAWVEFGRTGQIRDTTAPDPPAAVTTRKVANGTVITWRANADIESGIKEFRVYGDGQLLARIGSVVGDESKGNFHSWNYTDRPSPDEQNNAMRYTWRGTPYKIFSVTTINHFGLESSPAIQASP